MPLPTNDEQHPPAGAGLPTSLPRVETSPKTEPATETPATRLPSLPPVDESLPAPEEEEVFSNVPAQPEVEEPADAPEVVEEPVFQAPKSRKIADVPPAPLVEEPAPEPAVVEAEETEESTFIDKKNRKLKPFGGAKALRPKMNRDKKEDKNRFDPRNDRRAQARIIQWTVIGLLAAASVFGLYKDVFPPKGVSQSTVEQIVAQNTVTTYGYPMTEGASFATNFINAYLKISTATANSGEVGPQQSDPLLSWYYNGSDSSGTTDGSAISNKNISLNQNSNVAQKVIVPASIFNQIALSSKTAQYTIGAEVETNGGSPYWNWFYVDVYYSGGPNGSFAVAPNSPSPAPPQKVTTISAAAAPLGVGSQLWPSGPGGNSQSPLSSDQQSEITTEVQDFMAAWNQASTNNCGAMSAYTTSTASKSVCNGISGGLNGPNYSVTQSDTSVTSAYAYNSVGNYDSLSVVVATAFHSEGSDNSANGIAYTGSYNLLLDYTSGKYLVANIIPQQYIPSTNGS